MRNSSVRRILLRAPNWIGDAVMCEPALRAVRRCFPEASVTLLARPAVAELLAGHPVVQDCLVYEHRGAHRGIAGKWALSRELRRRRFDTAILFQNAFEAALLSFLAGIPDRIGYATDGRGFRLSRAVKVPARSEPQVDYYLGVLRPFGHVEPVEAPRLFVRPEEQDAMAARLGQAGVCSEDVLIGLNPGSTYGSAKRWLPDRFADTAARLMRICRDEQGRTARVVVLGAPGEEALGEQIAGRIGPTTLVWSGKTSVRELMAVTQRCQIYVTNDTGPMHVAAAFGVPVVAVFGPTDWRTTAPFGSGHALVRTQVDCAPCLLRECPIDHRCMTGVTVDQVTDAARRLLVVDSRLGALTPRHSAPGTHHLPLDGVTVFLDRDGTLIRDVGYLNDPQRIEWGSGVMEGLGRLKTAGARLVVVTNQSGIARGLIDTQQLAAIHEKLRADLAAHGITMEGIYACPHHPDDGCSCRKPEPGLVEQARRELKLDCRREYVVGDQERDIELGRRIGARTILVTAVPMGGDESARFIPQGWPPDHAAAGFAEAVSWIIADAESRNAAQPASLGHPADR